MAGRKAVTVHLVGQVRLRQRGSKKFWHARYTSSAGRKEQSLKVTNLKIAMRKAREINDMLEKGQYTEIETRHANRRTTFASFLEEFKTNFMGWSESTWVGCNSILKKLNQEFGELPLNNISTKQVESYLARKQDLEEVKTATINRYLATLKTLFKMAVRWGYLSYNPAEPIKIQKEDSEIPEALTEEQLEKLLDELPDYAKTIVTFAADTGMRSSELAKLRWSDIRFDERAIIVQGSTSKNNEFRVIYMTDRIHSLLLELQEQNRQSKIKQLQVLPWKGIKKSLHNAGVRAGIGHVHLHMLRHTFATRLRDKGVPLDRIKELLGHKTMTMVLRYAKARPEQLREAIGALN